MCPEGTGPTRLLPLGGTGRAVQEDPKPFWGYSDCSVILNALLTRTGHPGGSLADPQPGPGAGGNCSKYGLKNWLTQANQELFQPNWQFLPGKLLWKGSWREEICAAF